MTLSENKIFNPEGNDALEERTIIKGNVTGLFNLNATKYPWAKKLYQVMVGNFWVPEKVMGLGDDARMFNSVLTEDERRAYKGFISFLTFLDSIQTVNLPNISSYITSPEVNLILAIQSYQEAIHSQSYATILETVVDSKDREEIYYFWKTDETLLERNRYIGSVYQAFIDTPSDENFFKAVVADFILEAIYFYNGFSLFDTFVDQGKMQATGRMIAYIRRDELTHVYLFANILNEIKKEFPSMFNEDVIRDLMRVGVEQEITWSKHIIGDSIPGITNQTIEEYTKYLANDRLALIGIGPMYPDATSNPYRHLEYIQDTDNDKSNFFETTVINYTQSTGLKGSWDF